MNLMAALGRRAGWLFGLALWCVAAPAGAASLDLSKGACRFALSTASVAAAYDHVRSGACIAGSGGVEWLVQQDVDFSQVSGEPLVFHMKQAMFSRLSVHLRYTDGEHAHLVHDVSNASANVAFGGSIRLRLPERDAPIDAIALSVEGVIDRGNIFVRPTLTPLAAEAAQVDNAGLFYGIFAGFLLATLAFNVVLLFWLRYAFLLFYCGMTAATMLYGIATSGLIFQIVPGLPPPTAPLIGEFSMGIVLWCAVLFTIALLERRVVPVGLGIVSVVTASFATGAGLAALVTGTTAPNVSAAALSVLNGLGGFALLLVVPLAAIAMRRGSRVIYLFALAWSLPIAAGVARILAGSGLVEATPFIENSHFYAMSVEAVISMFGIAYRISHLRSERDRARASEIEMRYLAETDVLTGLLNRRAFIESAIQCGTGRDAELVLIDLDHFKTVNDGFGHDVGDRVLRAAAQLLEQVAPSGAVVGRLGGEEFAVMLPQSDGHATARQMLSAFRGTPMPEGIRLTASAGAAIGSFGDDAGWRAIYRSADAALYRAKADGRDRLVTDRSPVAPVVAAA